MSQLSKAKREIKRLKRCLIDVRHMSQEAAYERHEAGRSSDDDPCTKVCRDIWRRVNRTVKL